MKVTDTNEQNVGTKPQQCESANELAELSNEIRWYIQQIVGNNTETAANIQTKEKLATMKANIRKLTETMTVLAAALNKENKNPNKGQGKKNKGDNSDQNQSGKRAWIPYRNIEGYCHSCGFHPVGAGHNSSTCKNKKDGQKGDASWTNR